MKILPNFYWTKHAFVMKPESDKCAEFQVCIALVTMNVQLNKDL